MYIVHKHTISQLGSDVQYHFLYMISVSSVPDVTSFDSVTAIHCRNHWHHHWRRRIHLCRASIGASGCMEGKVFKGGINFPWFFFYGFLGGNFYHGYPQISIRICLCWVLVLLRVKLQINEGEWGISQFCFFHFEGTFISWIPRIVTKYLIKSFFSKHLTFPIPSLFLNIQVELLKGVPAKIIGMDILECWNRACLQVSAWDLCR